MKLPYGQIFYFYETYPKYNIIRRMSPNNYYLAIHHKNLVRVVRL
jgi:hypothetical protein